MSDDTPIPDAWAIYRMACAIGKKRTFWYLVACLGLPGRLNDWREPECAAMWTAFREGEDLKHPPTPRGWLTSKD